MTGTSSGRAGVPLWSAVYIDGECPVIELRRNVHVYGLRPAGIVENRAVGHSHSDLVDWASRLVRERELVHAILHILDVRKSSNPDREVDEREPGVRHPDRVNPGLVQTDYLISRGVKEVGVNFAVYALHFEIVGLAVARHEPMQVPRRAPTIHDAKTTAAGEAQPRATGLEIKHRRRPRFVLPSVVGGVQEGDELNRDPAWGVVSISVGCMLAACDNHSCGDPTRHRKLPAPARHPETPRPSIGRCFG